ncbi:hypothetical protein D512_21679 [Burkholderia pseudomallei MSHR1043]|uniref:Uncharacterized protein n=1 Tax=Burkholderia pseudomallei 1710a TaxID=320371 RepID=A0A0E1VX96_BURPE|nr:hypothetical protein BMA10247_A0995 [Burkholderia mallei NCTC 10247]EEP87992.1 conserved hypothetical protein [Burkholderia mallei GB8 horse 4]EET04641.1 hypothetical protein BURPS1710A_A0404 [Burkholderia pseudomallei 1710a]EMP75059.1 hypothetical protein D512_21679 [Burkholderia pseudomallei MSHR1043]KGS73975.1 hypothetical protein X942_5606 [Burkholderia pseudomallei MSHR5596]
MVNLGNLIRLVNSSIDVFAMFDSPNDGRCGNASIRYSKKM